jgi:hypothetical protein
MKKYRPLSILFLLLFSATQVLSQKVGVDLKRSDGSSMSYWRIADENAKEVVSENGHMNEDSVTFSLESDRLYSLVIIVQDSNIPVMLNYTLAVDGQEILHISEQQTSGDHEYKFFTGTRREPSKIIGGTNAAISDFPWQVYYISGSFLCGGSIISPGWILTAAHCTYNGSNNPIPAASMSIVAGTEAPSIYSSGRTYNVSQVFRHELYNPVTFAYDIALLKLTDSIKVSGAAPVKMVSAIDIADGSVSPGVMTWVTGWGLTKVSPQQRPTYLQKVQLPIVSNEVAALVWGSIPLTDLMAGYEGGSKDACNGDSGGPLVVPVTGEYKLAGIVSWGNSACNTYGAYTRVSDFAGWIAEKSGVVDIRPAIPGGRTVVCNSADTTIYEVDPYPGATSYEWKLYPQITGTITGTSTSARVTWKDTFTGNALVMVRTTVNKTVSDWSKLKVIVAPIMRLLAISKDSSICTDLPLSIMAQAEGNNLTYRWYKDNSLIQSGSSNSVGINSVKQVNSGIYRCDISNACGTISSNNISISVLPLTSIRDLTHDLNVSSGSSTTLNVTSEGYNMSYQWQKDGIMITDATDPILPLYDVNTKDIGLYRVTVKGTCGTITSDSIYVYVSSKGVSGTVDVLVWPTVTTDEINVALSNDDQYTIQIYNSGGLFVKEVKHCRYQTNIYIGTLASGNYILNVFNNSFRKSIRVIKY